MKFRGFRVPFRSGILYPVSPLSPKFREKIAALVVDDDKRRKIDHVDLPHRFHAELGIFQHLDLFDAVLRQPRRRAAAPRAHS